MTVRSWRGARGAAPAARRPPRRARLAAPDNKKHMFRSKEPQQTMDDCVRLSDATVHGKEACLIVIFLVLERLKRMYTIECTESLCVSRS